MSTAIDILKQVRHTIDPAADVLGALNEAIRVVAKRLYAIKSKIIHSDLSISIVADDTSASLPSDFWGMDSYPYLSGKSRHLLPLPSLAVKLSYTGTGIPLYYEIKGTSIYITPTTSGAYTIVGDYISKPTKLTATSDTVPYNELFDDVLTDYMKLYFTNPKGGVVSVPQNWLDKIDLVAARREKKAPFHTNAAGMGISWGNM